MNTKLCYRDLLGTVAAIPADGLVPDLPLLQLRPLHLLDEPRVSENPQSHSSVLSLERATVFAFQDRVFKTG